MKNFNLIDENGNEIKAEISQPVSDPTSIEGIKPVNTEGSGVERVTISHKILKDGDEVIEAPQSEKSDEEPVETVEVIESESEDEEVIDITPEIPDMPENFAGFPNSQGDPKCYIYFDMEFTGLRRDADIISIALVDNIGRSFYAVFNDYDENKVDDWLKENVISHLNTPTENVMNGNDWKLVGNRTEISNALHEWIKVLAEGRVTVQFIADVGHYDFVLLIDLLLNDTNKTALDLPEYISPCLYDMNQDISTHVFINPKESIGLVPIRAAFDIARLDAIKDMELEPPEGEQHNAMYDAKILKAMHNYLWNIE